MTSILLQKNHRHRHRRGKDHSARYSLRRYEDETNAREKLNMADVFSTKQRSAVMAAVRGNQNKSTELRLIKIFRELGITGWRRKSTLPGKPDFVFRAQRVTLFVDGCFWHGCPFHSKIPASNRAYWTAKISRNVQRDRRLSALLRSKGWHVVRVWEHELRTKELPRTCKKLIRVTRRLVEL